MQNRSLSHKTIAVEPADNSQTFSRKVCGSSIEAAVTFSNKSLPETFSCGTGSSVKLTEEQKAAGCVLVTFGSGKSVEHWFVLSKELVEKSRYFSGVKNEPTTNSMPQDRHFHFDYEKNPPLLNPEKFERILELLSGKLAKSDHYYCQPPVVELANYLGIGHFSLFSHNENLLQLYCSNSVTLAYYEENLFKRSSQEVIRNQFSRFIEETNPSPEACKKIANAFFKMFSRKPTAPTAPTAPNSTTSEDPKKKPEFWVSEVALPNLNSINRDLAKN